MAWNPATLQSLTKIRPDSGAMAANGQAAKKFTSNIFHVGPFPILQDPTACSFTLLQEWGLGTCSRSQLGPVSHLGPVSQDWWKNDKARSRRRDPRRREAPRSRDTSPDVSDSSEPTEVCPPGGRSGGVLRGAEGEYSCTYSWDLRCLSLS